MERQNDARFLFVVVAFKIANIVSLILSWIRLFLFGNERKPNIQGTVSSALTVL
jgi:hypothetical protein